MAAETLQFEDLELLVESIQQPGRYTVKVKSQAGQDGGTLALDPNDPEIKSALDAIAGRDTTDDLLRQFGGRLFDALLADPIGDLYNRSQGLAQGAGKRLRIRLGIDPPEISALPWEYLFDPKADLPLAISPNHCLSRYVSVNEPVRTLEVEPPLRVLVVVSDPSDLGVPILKADEEIQRIKTALQKHEAAGRVKTDVLPHAVAAELRDKLRAFRPHVVHLIGHGGFQNNQGMVVMEDEDHRKRLVSDRQFREFFLGADDARLVILNVCQGATQSSSRALTGLAPQIVRRGLGAVVAMQYPVPDKVALSFAREFYRALAQYYPVDAAVTEGRRAVYMDFGSDQPDWGTPVTFMRSPDGVLFSPPFAQQAQAAQPSTSGVVITGGTVNIGGDVAGRDVIKSNVPFVSPAQPDSGAPTVDKPSAELRELLVSLFNLEELRDLCFDLNVDFDSLGGEGKSGKARELVAYMQRRGRLPDLIAGIRRAQST